MAVPSFSELFPSEPKTLRDTSVLMPVSLPVSLRFPYKPRWFDIFFNLLGLANFHYERLMWQIAEFEATLSSEEEIGAYLTTFGRVVTISIEKVGYHNPYLIIFYGRDQNSGQQVQLVQHVNQISVLFIAVPKSTERSEPRRIGFSLGKD